MDGKVPFIMGKKSLVENDCIEAHGRGWLQITTKLGPIRLKTDVKHHDGHARIPLNFESAMINVAESMLVRHENKIGGKELVRRIHSKTHLHPPTVEFFA